MAADMLPYALNDCLPDWCMAPMFQGLQHGLHWQHAWVQPQCFCISIANSSCIQDNYLTDEFMALWVPNGWTSGWR